MLQIVLANLLLVRMKIKKLLLKQQMKTVETVPQQVVLSLCLNQNLNQFLDLVVNQC